MGNAWVSVLFVVTMLVMGVMAYLGLDELFGLHREGWRRFLSGGLILISSMLAAYLLIWEWLPADGHSGLGLFYILAMSLAGYGIARTLDFLLLPFEDREAWDAPYVQPDDELVS